MLFLKCVGICAGSARIANVVLSLTDLLEVRWELPEALEQVDLKSQTAAPRIVIEHVLKRRVRNESPVPVVFAINLDSWKARRQRTARHDMLGTNSDFPAVEISETACAYVYGSNAETHFRGAIS